MNYSTVKYRIIVCKKKISQTFPNYRFKNNYFDAFYRWKRTHAKILRFKRTKDRREGRRRNKKTCILGKHMKHIEGGKTLGQISFDISKCLEAVFPSATISTCMSWCHGILRYTREWVLLRFPSLQCRWFPPPLAILGAPQIHLTSYLTLGWKKITKSFRSKKFPFFWDTLYRVLHRYTAIYIYSYIIFFILSWKLFIWNWHFRFIHVSFSIGMENFNFSII